MATAGRGPGRVFAWAGLDLGRGRTFWIVGIDPDSGTWAKAGEQGQPAARVAPDGRTMAIQGFNDMDNRDGIWLRELREGGAEPRRLCDLNGQVSWSSDGRRLIVSDDPGGSWVVDVDGSVGDRLPIPPEDRVVDWSADGRWLLVLKPRRSGADESDDARPLALVRVDGTGERPVGGDADLNFQARLSPDGRRVVYGRPWPGGERIDVRVVEPDRTTRQLARDGVAPIEACWSPDGTRLALVYAPVALDPKGNAQAGEMSLMIVDEDGGNPRPIALPPTLFLRLLDWR